jgi:hypothetical protein
VPHRDNTPRAMLGRNEAKGVMGNDREVTAILYLNPPDWDAQRWVPFFRRVKWGRFEGGLHARSNRLKLKRSSD